MSRVHEAQGWRETQRHYGCVNDAVETGRRRSDRLVDVIGRLELTGDVVTPGESRSVVAIPVVTRLGC